MLAGEIDSAKGPTKDFTDCKPFSWAVETVGTLRVFVELPSLSLDIEDAKFRLRENGSDVLVKSFDQMLLCISAKIVGFVSDCVAAENSSLVSLSVRPDRAPLPECRVE